MVLFIESKLQDIVGTEMQSLSLNNGHLSHKSLFYWDCGSFILLRDVNVDKRNKRK